MLISEETERTLRSMTDCSRIIERLINFITLNPKPTSSRDISYETIVDAFCPVGFLHPDERVDVTKKTLRKIIEVAGEILLNDSEFGPFYYNLLECAFLRSGADLTDVPFPASVPPSRSVPPGPYDLRDFILGELRNYYRLLKAKSVPYRQGERLLLSVLYNYLENGEREGIQRRMLVRVKAYLFNSPSIMRILDSCSLGQEILGWLRREPSSSLPLMPEVGVDGRVSPPSPVHVEPRGGGGGGGGGGAGIPCSSRGVVSPFRPVVPSSGGGWSDEVVRRSPSPGSMVYSPGSPPPLLILLIILVPIHYKNQFRVKANGGKRFVVSVI